MTRKEMKKLQKQQEYELQLKAMGSKAFEKEQGTMDDRNREFLERILK